MLIPAFGEGRDLASLGEKYELDAVVERLDGLFLTGSPSNVMPHEYDGQASVPGTLHDEQRDCLTLPLIHVAVDAGLPLFAVCRGIQEVNVAFGGSLHQRIQEVSGKDDHREDKGLAREDQYGPAHAVALTEGGLRFHFFRRHATSFRQHRHGGSGQVRKDIDGHLARGPQTGPG